MERLPGLGSEGPPVVLLVPDNDSARHYIVENFPDTKLEPARQKCGVVELDFTTRNRQVTGAEVHDLRGFDGQVNGKLGTNESPVWLAELNDGPTIGVPKSHPVRLTLNGNDYDPDDEHQYGEAGAQTDEVQDGRFSS